MTVSLGSNLSSLRAMRELGATRNSLAQIFERLSSGQRINRAADDAAALAISEALRTDSRVTTKGLQNTSDAISLLNIAEGAVESLTEIVTRQIELAEQSANGVYSDEQRSALNTELISLYQEYSRILNGTQFNGLNILDIDFGRMTIQTGGNSVSLAVLSQETVGAGELILDGYDTIDVNNHSAANSVIQEDRLLTTDYNGDGFDDLVTIGLITAGKGNFISVKVYTGDENGLTLTGQRDIDVGAGKITGYTSFSAGLRGSSTKIQLDVITDNAVITRGATSIDPASGALGLFLPGETTLTNEATAGSIIGDFNGDGYNDTVLTSDSFVSSATSGFLRFIMSQTSATTEAQQVSVSLERLSANILSESSALGALDTLREDLSLLSNTRAAIGASLSRLTVTQTVLQAKRAELEAADDRIRSADIAEESSKLVLSQIREQAATAVLAQANIQPNLALQLLRQDQ